MKKLISVILCLLLIALSVVSSGAVVVNVTDTKSTSGSCGENATWSYDEETKTLTISGEGAMYNYSSYSLSPWHEAKIDIEKVVIEEGITVIGDYSFYNFSGITEVVFPDTLTCIGETAFSGCGRLSNVVLPESLKGIKGSAFSYCRGITEIIIPANVMFVKSTAFKECNKLERITFLNPICEIANYYTINKSTVIYGGEGSTAQEYAQKNKMTFVAIETSEIKTNGDCGESATWSYDEETKTLTISGTGAMDDFDYNYNPTYWSVFLIEKVVVEEGITALGDSAFADLEELVEISLPQSLEKVGVYTFRECSNLKEIVLPDTLTTFSVSSFCGCRGLTSFDIPSAVTELPPHVFGACQKLESIYIHAGLTNIAKTAFQGCASVKSIVVDTENPVYDSRDNCNSIILTESNSLYLGSSTTYIPDTITSIDDDAFDMTFGPEELIIPGNVKTIGKEAFYAIRSRIIIEEGVEVIEERAFANAQTIQKIIVPKSVKYIGDSAFGMSMIEEIVILNPDCEIFDSSYTLPNSWASKIYGLENSTAQAYAEKYNRIFEIYVEPEYQLGDVDMDGEVSIIDATLIQRYLAQYIRLSKQQLQLADMDKDTEVNILDATYIQRELASLA